MKIIPAFFITGCLTLFFLQCSLAMNENKASQGKKATELELVREILGELLPDDNLSCGPLTAKKSLSDGNTLSQSPIFPNHALQGPKNTSPRKKWNPGEEPPDVQDSSNPKTRKVYTWKQNPPKND